MKNTKRTRQRLLFNESLPPSANNIKPMRHLTAILLLSLISLSAPSAHAFKEPPGSSDHPLVGRYQGSYIKNFTRKSLEETLILIRPVKESDNGQKTGNNSIALSGGTWRISYAGPEGRPPLEVMKHFEAALKVNQFEQRFSCRGVECGPGYGSQFWKAATSGGNASIAPSWETQLYSVFERPSKSGSTWLALLIVEGRKGSYTEPEILMDIVDVTQKARNTVEVVTASEIQKALSTDGRIPLYGIVFDQGSTTIKPESTPALDEVAQFLRENPQVQLVVAGHTDSTGGFDYSLDLSRRRATAICDTLASRYGLSQARLTPFGAGMTSPVRSNDTEEGRAKNQRVELVKREQ